VWAVAQEGELRLAAAAIRVPRSSSSSSMSATPQIWLRLRSDSGRRISAFLSWSIARYTALLVPPTMTSASSAEKAGCSVSRSSRRRVALAAGSGGADDCAVAAAMRAHQPRSTTPTNNASWRRRTDPPALQGQAVQDEAGDQRVFGEEEQTHQPVQAVQAEQPVGQPVMAAEGGLRRRAPGAVVFRPARRPGASVGGGGAAR
jgi:hypothetical protein